MILRPRQEQFVARARAALAQHGNTLAVAPTGFGKTVALSAAVLEELPQRKIALVLQHRDELVAQNRAAFVRMAGAHGPRSSVINSKIRDPHGKVIFAMVQSLANVLEILPANIGLVATDETHHAAAKTYRKIYEHIQSTSSQVAFLGVTATPERGDKKSLLGVYNNVCDVVTLGEIIRAGNLVRPRAMVVDIGVQGELGRVKRTAADFDMGEVEEIMDKTVHHEAVIKHWREAAGDRQTVVFCSTVAHSQHVCEAFRAAGVKAEHIDGATPAAERAAILRRFDRGESQVLCNVMVLTEGWDCQPVSCVVLLRPSSHASTMIQMIGRGLRKQDPERYPHRPPKRDCIIMDFGTSLLTHGTLDADVTLDPHRGAARTKVCPSCTCEIPAGCRTCPLCQHEFPEIISDRVAAGEQRADDLRDFVLTEIDILNASPFRWETLWQGDVLMASGFSAWAMAIHYRGSWYAVGGSKEKGVHVLDAGCAASLQAIASADDWMRQHGDRNDAGKAKRWLLEPATPAQIGALRRHGPVNDNGLTKYLAGCMLTYKANENVVRSKVIGAAA